MKSTFLTVVTLLLAQPAFTKILSGTIDLEAKQVRLLLEVRTYCNNPKFKIVANHCAKRIDGPCYFTLEQTLQNRMLCRPGTTGIIHVTVPAPEAMLDERNTIYLNFQDKPFQLREAAFWRK